MDHERIRWAWITIMAIILIASMVFIFAFDSPMTTIFVLVAVLIIFTVGIILDFLRKRDIKINR